VFLLVELFVCFIWYLMDLFAAAAEGEQSQCAGS
jgi:hypothetical protein